MWLEENTPTPLGEIAVATVAEEPDAVPGPPDDPDGGSGCAGILVAVLGVASVLLPWIRELLAEH